MIYTKVFYKCSDTFTIYHSSKEDFESTPKDLMIHTY